MVILDARCRNTEIIVITGPQNTIINNNTQPAVKYRQFYHKYILMVNIFYTLFLLLHIGVIKVKIIQL